MKDQSFQIHTIPSIYSAADLILLKSVTPVHAGVGRTGGIVDLPIQKDEIGYPCIYSSSIKGALKTALLSAMIQVDGNYINAKKRVTVLLGPEPEEGETFESSIAILDAYLIALPVRSLKGVYVYVTSPFLLKKFKNILELLNIYAEKSSSQNIIDIEKLEELIEWIEANLSIDEAICLGPDKKCCEIKIKELNDKAMLVEELLLNIKTVDKNHKDTAEKLLEILNPDKTKNEESKEHLILNPLLVLYDDIAPSVIDRSLLRLTRIRLSKETKTVTTGGLWSEEYLPINTILYTLVLYKKPPLSQGFIRNVRNKKEGSIDEEDYLETLKDLGIIDDDKVDKMMKIESISEKMKKISEELRKAFKKSINEKLKGYLILGGHETIGKGIIKILFAT